MKVSTKSQTVRTDVHNRRPFGRTHEEFALEPEIGEDSLEAALLANDGIQNSMAMAHRGEDLVRRVDGRRDVTTE